MLVALVVCVVGASAFANLLENLSTQVDNIYIAKKLNDIAATISGNSAVGDVAARTDRYGQDIRLFFNTYMLGVGPQYANAVSNSIVDGHSDLFGNLARYGAIWGIFFFIYTRKFVASVRQTFPGRNESSNSAVYIAFLFMLIVQPVLASVEIMSTVCIIVPCIDTLLDSARPKSQR